MDKNSARRSSASDFFGKPPVFTRAESQDPRAHPRVLFDANKFSASVTRWATNSVTPGTFEYWNCRRAKITVNNVKQNTLRQDLDENQIRAMIRAAGRNGYLTEVETQGFYIQALRAFMYREQTRRA